MPKTSHSFGECSNQVARAEEKGNLMRQFNRAAGRYRWHERTLTESQIMKFTKPRDPDDLTSLILAEPKFLPNATLIELVTISEPVRQPALAKGASA